MPTFIGTSENDVLTGTSEADVIDGAAGADTMSGLGGDDEYWVDNTGDVVIEHAGEGFDTINTTLSSGALPDNVEALVYWAPPLPISSE